MEGPSAQAVQVVAEHQLVPRMGKRYTASMQVIAKRTLKLFWERHPRAEAPLRTWYALADKAAWSTPHDLKLQFGSTVDFVADNRVIFDIGGNKYRLIVRVSYEFGRVLIKFVGTHEDYDRIDPEVV